MKLGILVLAFSVLSTTGLLTRIPIISLLPKMKIHCILFAIFVFALVQIQANPMRDVDRSRYGINLFHT